MPELVHYLIVGGGVAGGHAVFEIRKHDKSGRIVVVNQEDQLPYDRPPLSKEYLGGKMKRSDVFFRADSYYARNKVEVMRGHQVQSVNTSDRSVRLDDGRELAYKVLLIATGGRVRKLEIPGSDLEGIYYLRTIEDCDFIKKGAKSSNKKKKVVIVGGGFIGCEVAATLRGRGLNVTLLEMSSHLLSAAIDEETAEWIKGYHSKKGVDVLTNVSAVRFVGKDGQVKGVELKDGKILDADFVVVGVGIIPNTEVAENAGLKVDKGILVDKYLKASARDVYAAGDAARFYSPVFKRNLRVEHVDIAQKQGTTAGRNMTGLKRKPFDELPYFFSYQFDLEINAYGDLSQHSTIVRRGKMNAKTGFIQFYFDGATLNGILSVNADWKDIEKAKTLIESRKDFADPSILSDESKNSLASIIKERESPKKK